MSEKPPKIVKNMPTLGEMLDSRFLRWFDLAKDGKFIEAKITISGVRIEKVFIPNANQEQDKPVLTFEGKEKCLILNKTNTKMIADKLGADTKNWTGKEITLYVDENVRLRGKKTCGLRVR